MRSCLAGLIERLRLRFAGLFVPVFWDRAGFTFYANRFDTDDLAYRLLGLVAMFAVAALATVIGDAFRGEATTFVLAFVGARVVLVALWRLFPCGSWPGSRSSSSVSRSSRTRRIPQHLAK